MNLLCVSLCALWLKSYLLFLQIEDYCELLKILFLLNKLISSQFINLPPQNCFYLYFDMGYDFSFYETNL